MENTDKEVNQVQRIDVRDEFFSEVEINGRMGLFTELRIDKSSIPYGLYCYELRHGDDDSYPCTMESSVTVNYFGAVLMKEPVVFTDKREEVGYDSFGYTGNEMQIYEFMGREPEFIVKAEELTGYIRKNGLAFDISEEEADILLGYLEGHDFCIGEMDGCLYRGDFDCEPGKIVWQADTVDDVIAFASEMNYELIQEAEMENTFAKSTDEIKTMRKKLETLKEHEIVLDRLFQDTKHYEAINQEAELIAAAFLASLKEKTVEEAVTELAGVVKQLVGGKAR